LATFSRLVFRPCARLRNNYPNIEAEIRPNALGPLDLDAVCAHTNNGLDLALSLEELTAIMKKYCLAYLFPLANPTVSDIVWHDDAYNQVNFLAPGPNATIPATPTRYRFHFLADATYCTHCTPTLTATASHERKRRRSIRSR
jgi:hypothetical protein